MEQTRKQNGMMVVDKPEGVSSAYVVSRLRKILKTKKIGHTGTLDPFATGVLVCGINGGTRLSRFFLEGNKTYAAEIKLGEETDTLDCTGEQVASTDIFSMEEWEARLSRESIEAVLRLFEGEIMQTPPVYSALKHNGVPLYKLARKGTPVTKPPRKVTIPYIRLTGVDLPFVTIEVECSGGTYIRTLASDIGRELGCGGHLTKLRRLDTCGFSEDDAVTLDELDQAPDAFSRMVSLSDSIGKMACHRADDRLAQKIRHGQTIGQEDGLVETGEHSGGFVKIVDEGDGLLAVMSYSGADKSYNYCCVFNN